LFREIQPSQNHEALVPLALSLVPGMGNRGIHQFIALLEGHHYDISRLTTERPASVCAHVPEALRFQRVLEHLARETLETARQYIERASRSGLTVIHFKDRRYPDCLREFLEKDAPPVLFLYGAVSLLDNPGGAVVGTRFPTNTGLSAARYAAEALSGAGLTMVSGGAAGVDRAAHDAALSAGGSTIVFLPQGIEGFPLSEEWKEAMEEGKLLLASEYLPDAPWRTYAAVSRNALIAAQSLLVCVIEPRKQGGSVLTARHAMEQGKPVFIEPAGALSGTLKGYAQPLKSLRDMLDTMTTGGFNFHPRPRQSKLF